MLIVQGGQVIDRDDYAIHHANNGLDEVTFELSACDNTYSVLLEGKTVIDETTEHQRYVP